MYERPEHLRAMEIDPKAPGVADLLRGARGEAWRHFTLAALTTLGSLFLLSAFAAWSTL